DGVRIFAGADRVDAGVFDGVRNIKIGLADRKVDRVLHLRGEVEHFADTAGIEGLSAVGEEGHSVRGQESGDMKANRQYRAVSGQGTSRLKSRFGGCFQHPLQVLSTEYGPRSTPARGNII